jgi:hypothetical protein
MVNNSYNEEYSSNEINKLNNMPSGPDEYEMYNTMSAHETEYIPEQTMYQNQKMPKNCCMPQMSQMPQMKQMMQMPSFMSPPINYMCNMPVMKPAYSHCQGTCIPQETEIRNVKLANAYVPWQKFCGTYSPIESLRKGTVFPELHSPYHKMGQKGMMCQYMHEEEDYE